MSNHVVQRGNTRIRFERLMEREREKAAKANTQKHSGPVLSQSRQSVIEALIAVVEDRCKAGGTFSCRPKDLLLLIYKKSHLVYDAEFHGMLAGNDIDECANVIRPHMQAKNIECGIFGLPGYPNRLLRFRLNVANR
jgi:hypothetical protein